MIKHLIIFLLTFFCCANSFSQQKFEYEHRIDEDQLPINTLEIVKLFGADYKTKWYKEHSNDGLSYEAKFKNNKKYWSVEFDSTGVFKDVEIIVDFKKLDSNIQNSIDSILRLTYDKIKIQKTQIQFSGDPKSILNHINNNKSDIQVVKNYELVIKCKVEHTWKSFEMTFDEKGRLIKKLETIELNTDHLDF